MARRGHGPAITVLLDQVAADRHPSGRAEPRRGPGEGEARRSRWRAGQGIEQPAARNQQRRCGSAQYGASDHDWYRAAKTSGTVRAHIIAVTISRSRGPAAPGSQPEGDPGGDAPRSSAPAALRRSRWPVLLGEGDIAGSITPTYTPNARYVPVMTQTRRCGAGRRRRPRLGRPAARAAAPYSAGWPGRAARGHQEQRAPQPRARRHPRGEQHHHGRPDDVDRFVERGRQRVRRVQGFAVTEQGGPATADHGPERRGRQPGHHRGGKVRPGRRTGADQPDQRHEAADMTDQRSRDDLILAVPVGQPASTGPPIASAVPKTAATAPPSANERVTVPTSRRAPSVCMAR